MSIGNNAFYNCNALTTITIPGSVTNIGSHAFGYCSLSSVTFADTTTEWFAASGWMEEEKGKIIPTESESIGAWSSDALENAKKLAGYYYDSDKGGYWNDSEYAYKFLYSEKYNAQ